jgi:hypothetical protein
VVYQRSGGAIAFSLTQTNDTTGGDPNGARANFSGLTMNEFSGNQVSGDVNFGQGRGTNVIAFDPTQCHEFWIVLGRDRANVGTHQGFIYRDGSQSGNDSARDSRQQFLPCKAIKPVLCGRAQVLAGGKAPSSGANRESNKSAQRLSQAAGNPCRF